MNAGHHLGSDPPTSVPRPEGRARNTGGVNGFLQGHPSLFDRMTGELPEQQVPPVSSGPVSAFAHHVKADTVTDPAI